jgi:hypothetical protein
MTTGALTDVSDGVVIPLEVSECLSVAINKCSKVLVEILQSFLVLIASDATIVKLDERRTTKEGLRESATDSRLVVAAREGDSERVA